MARRALALLVLVALAPAASALVPAAPRADFTYAPTDPRAGDAVTFAAHVEGGAPILVATWDLGDGASLRCDPLGCASPSDPAGRMPTPTHAFARHGVYAVALTVTDALGRSSSFTRSVWVLNSPPHAGFVASPSTATRGQTVTFSDLSTDVDGDAIVTRDWDLGEGQHASGLSVATTYATLGDRLVTLTVMDDQGATSQATGTVRVVDAPPMARIAIAPSAPVRGEPVTFTASAVDPDSNDALDYAWSFDDGTRMSGGAVTRTFAETGTHDVVLEVSDADGGVGTASARFFVDAPTPHASFTVAPDPPIAREPTQFTDTSTSANGDIVSWAWDFGDGASSASRAPTHAYAEGGVFTVRLHVIDASGRAGVASRDVTVRDQ